MTARKCKHCGAELARHDREGPAHYDRRVTCGRHECRFPGRGQRYSSADRALVGKHYPEGGALAVWYNGWPHKEGGKRRQLSRIRDLAFRMKIHTARQSSP
jgi:hypothetical protein